MLVGRSTIESNSARPLCIIGTVQHYSLEFLMSSVPTTSALESLVTMIAECDSDFYEVVDGVKKELRRPNAFESVLAAELAHRLGIFADEHALGWVTGETLFVLDSTQKLQRRPDVAFVSVERGRANPLRRTNAWDVVPDLAVEIVSPTNTAEEIVGKLVEYFQAGVRAVWVIYPDSQQTYAYSSPKNVTILERGDAIPGGEVLPGFSLPIAKLFDSLQK